MKNVLKNKFVFSERSDRRTFRYFNIMYAIALTAVAMVTVSSYVLVQRIIFQQKNDSNVVNVAGRQRMLSQKISKAALKIIDYNTGKANVEELSASFKIWVQYHEGLRFGDVTLDIPTSNSRAVEQMFDELNPSYQKMKNGVEGLLEGIEQNDMSKLTINKSLILDNEATFLKAMDKIVFQYAEEAKAKLEELKQLETILLSIVIFTLFLEVIFIFNPVGRKIKTVISDLVESESKAQALAEELKNANVSLMRSNKDNRDINFALNEATILIKTDRDGKITFANQKYCAITRYSLDQLLGKMLFENNLGAEESIVYEHIRHPERCRQVWQGEIYDHAKDYTFFWLDVTIIPIVSIEGQLYQYLVICSDITKRKETELELQKMNEAKLLKQQYEQKIRSTSIITGQERERKRMSQEIHDGIGQMLTALKFGLESFVSEEEKEKKRLADLKSLLQTTIKEVRRISSDLLPTVLQDYGLSSALKELVTISQNASAIPIVFSDKLMIDKRLNKNIEISLYRICQESINNAIKYSQGSKIKVKLTNDVEFINLIIEDDGNGFDLSEIEKLNRTRESGNGLNNIRERADLINAKLYINSTPSKGTTIFVELALEEDIFDQNYG